MIVREYGKSSMLVSGLVVLALVSGLSFGSFLDEDLRELSPHVNFTGKEQEFLKEKDHGLSLQCADHLAQYIQALRSRELWAIEMFDAGAKLPSGLVVGNIVDLGSFDECLDIERSLTSDDSIFGRYCIGTLPTDIDFRHVQKQPKRQPIATPDGQTGIQMAVCLPDACSAAEIGKVYAAAGAGMVFYEELCQTKAEQPKFDGRAVAGMSFFSAILGIMFLSTTYDVVLYYKEKKAAHSLLTAFSVFTNGRRLITTESSNSSQILCLHGIRVISTVWIILDHRYSIQYQFPLRNHFYISTWTNDAANMFMINATLAVDTFFLMAGLVVTYTFLGAVAKGANFSIARHYIHRYLRLTPVLAALIIFHLTLTRHLGSGPLWPNIIENELIIGCERFWWKTLLYIQNYGREANMCISHGWYLSTDMQLFLLSPFFLLSLKRWPKVTLTVAGLLAACSIIACFLIAWFFKLNAIMQTEQDFDKLMQYVWYIYFPMPTRAAPWLIGVVLGYVVFRTKQEKDYRLISKGTATVLWLISLITLYICVFSGHGLVAGEYNRLENSMHIALVRPAWALAVGWVIFACVIGYGGPVDWFLSLPAFQVLSKLTYCLYLVHYGMMFIITAQMRTTILFSNFQAIYMFWGDFAFTLMVSLVFTLAFELPVITIEKFLFGLGRRKEREEKMKELVGANQKK